MWNILALGLSSASIVKGYISWGENCVWSCSLCLRCQPDMTVGMLSYTRVSRMSTHYNLSPDMFVNWVGFTPEWATVHTHQQSTLCMKGVWCRSGGVPLTARCSLHCTTENSKSVGPQADGERGHWCFCVFPVGCARSPLHLAVILYRYPNYPAGVVCCLDHVSVKGTQWCICVFQGKVGSWELAAHGGVEWGGWRWQWSRQCKNLPEIKIDW